jgi:hypothetical protein
MEVSLQPPTRPFTFRSVTPPTDLIAERGEKGITAKARRRPASGPQQIEFRGTRRRRPRPEE